MNKHSAISFRVLLLWLIAALFLAWLVGDSYAQRRGGLSGSFNSAAAPRYSPPRPMMPSQVRTPRPVPSQFNSAARGATPTFNRGAAGAGMSTGTRMVRPLPPSIKPNSAITRVPSYTGRITTTGAPIVVTRTNKIFSVPQNGFFSARVTATYRQIRTSLVKSLGTGKVTVLGTKITQIATGKTITKLNTTTIQKKQYIGYSKGEAISAFTDNRIQHASRHLIDAGILPKWNKSTGEKFKEIGVQILESPSRTFDHTLGATPVKGFSGMVDGKTVVFFVFKSGPFQGTVATAVVPSATQIADWGL